MVPGVVVDVAAREVRPRRFTPRRAMNPLDAILAQAQGALDAGLYFPALFTALTFPDICAAIEAPDVKPGARYTAWVNKHLPGYSGESLWKFRCRLLHEEMATIPPKAPTPPTAQGVPTAQVTRYFFIEPGAPMRLHNVALGNFEGELALGIDLHQFVADVATAVRAWFQGLAKTHEVQLRLWGCIQRRPSLRGLIAGVPVIG